MTKRVFGLESELAVSVTFGNGRLEMLEDLAVPSLIRKVRNVVATLPDRYSESGLYCQNGSRVYLDYGGHPEISTPEVSHPADAMRYKEAGHRLFKQAALQRGDRGVGFKPFFMTRCNIDYTGCNVTWGEHESYGHSISDFDLLCEQLVPHLVSRVCFTGAGGLNPREPGIVFSVSPRSFYHRCLLSESSTGARGIIHLRNEPLNRRNLQRLHLTVGENLCSHRGTFLKVGTTALVIAMIENHAFTTESVVLRDPVQALHQFAGDPGCKAQVRTQAGWLTTARDIQYHYLHSAERLVDASFMPDWAPEVIQYWRQTLDALAHPDSLTTTLDWPLKKALFEQHVRKQHFPTQAIPIWNDVAVRLHNALIAKDEYHLCAAHVTDRESVIADTVKELRPFLQDNGLSWDTFPAFLRLRDEICEIDWRFGALGDDGIFNSLHEAGVLSHTIAGVDDAAINKALYDPPADGRAHLRGANILRLSKNPRRYKCDWQAILDMEQQQALDLSDPFAAQARWKPFDECFAELV